MKIGFVTGREGHLHDGVLHTDAGLGRLIDALAPHATSMTVAACISPERRAHHDHATTVKASSVRALPVMQSTVRALPHGAICRAQIAHVESVSDVVIVQLPFAPPWALLPSRTPRVYHACADTPRIVRASPYRKGLQRAAAIVFADFMHSWQRALVRERNTAVVANGDELLQRLSAVRGTAVVSSTLTQAEVDSVKRTRPKDAPPRVLFVGYLRPEKGLQVLVEAFAQVRARLANAELVVVGDAGLTQARAQTELHERLRAWTAAGVVRCVGHTPFGRELFAHYADADVLVLPSQSEGTPRVLLEARAFRCPVVASHVGGIPSSVTHDVDGLLVAPSDADGFARGIVQVLTQPVLHARLVAAGLSRARGSTVEAFAGVLADEARRLWRDQEVNA